MMQIRTMVEADRFAVLDLMRMFYESDAVRTNGSEEIFQRDIDACVGNCMYAEGYVFVDDDRIVGYGMIAESYSTEFGKPCIWLEDIYVLPDYRGKGFGSAFIRKIRKEFPECILRLELEKENVSAAQLYRKYGFMELPYMEMISA